MSYNPLTQKRVLSASNISLAFSCLFVELADKEARIEALRKEIAELKEQQKRTIEDHIHPIISILDPEVCLYENNSVFNVMAFREVDGKPAVMIERKPE